MLYQRLIMLRFMIHLYLLTNFMLTGFCTDPGPSFPKASLAYVNREVW